MNKIRLSLADLNFYDFIFLITLKLECWRTKFRDYSVQNQQFLLILYKNLSFYSRRVVINKIALYLLNLQLFEFN